MSPHEGAVRIQDKFGNDLPRSHEHLKAHTHDGAWWVADYARNRGQAPIMVAGPYRTRLEAEMVARKRSKASK